MKVEGGVEESMPLTQMRSERACTTSKPWKLPNLGSKVRTLTTLETLVLTPVAGVATQRVKPNLSLWRNVHTLERSWAAAPDAVGYLC